MVVRRKMETDVLLLQDQIKSCGAKVHIILVGEVYCYIFFFDEDSGVSYLRSSCRR